MKIALLVVAVCILVAGMDAAAPRQHTVSFGAWRTASIASDSDSPEQVKVRDLLVDGRAREHVTGLPHDVTERIFVVRRAYRLNDSLPADAKKPLWVWRLGGWISVDRLTGKITQLNLPAFDPDLSEASWYRDYAAYCGTSDDGNKAYLMVVQLGRRKPVLKKEFSGDSCPAPAWERKPSRVTFTNGTEKTSFVVHARSAELQIDNSDDEGQP
jgi:hypothetical protein